MALGTVGGGPGKWDLMMALFARHISRTEYREVTFKIALKPKRPDSRFGPIEKDVTGTLLSVTPVLTDPDDENFVIEFSSLENNFKIDYNATTRKGKVVDMH